MSQSQQIIARIYDEMQKLVFDFYLVAADKAAEEGDANREEALRWLAENRRMPMVWHTNSYGEGYHWNCSVEGYYEPTCVHKLVSINDYEEPLNRKFDTFEAAVEAFIQVWPKIKPKRFETGEEVMGKYIPVYSNKIYPFGT